MLKDQCRYLLKTWFKLINFDNNQPVISTTL